LGDAEVGEVGPRFLVEQDVGRLDVAVLASRQRSPVPVRFDAAPVLG
jgi:hypothetical protein